MKFSVSELKKKAGEMRIDIIKMICEAKSGHPGGSLSAIDVLTVLYFNILKHDPKNPSWPERDRFILSKGHVCPALYAVMAHSGYFPREQLNTLRKIGSPLQGHPHMLKLTGLETSSGSLGQGLSIAVGMALGFKLDKLSNRVYCMVGDGETNEGQIWEAAMTAAHHKLDNLCCIVDFNGLQIDGFTKNVKNLEPFPDKWLAFGWHTISIDGHNMQEINDAFEEAKTIKEKPTVIIAKTVKGKGVSFMENQASWHGTAPNKEQAALAIKELKGDIEGDIHAQ